MLAAERAIDTVVWQLAASVAIPGYTIHTVVAIAHAGLAQLEASEQLQAGFAAAAPALGTTAEEWVSAVVQDLAADLPEETADGPDSWIAR